VPSRSESFGLVALEAQACGTPVVAAAVGGLRTVVRGGGVLVEGHDPADHADAVRAVLSDANLSASLGAAGARESLGFTWDATTTEVRTVYRELVESAA
jgi:D-inositol-3-phosphate glycosyltransferase